MALLQLKDIGKIYVSDKNVSVGIRNVNLSFDCGEFVAITGKSGSGKSTLLNVISGMDTYEEGELYIEGQTTSHYLQSEWEEYRKKYISFIFQDYNIIDSFTVLQNVELALMHIESKKERRKRALSLIKRVGLYSHKKQKGSKLSGGQKQRTVIARALAKDSPIILADEPTGNLDSATSIEIIELLREVSKNKLLIVVTHNFEQVEKYATRHIRVFDGTIEADDILQNNSIDENIKIDASSKRSLENNKKEKKHHFKNGILLGKTMFKSKPKLSFFTCLLMIIGTLGIFFATSSFGNMGKLLEPQYMFTHIEGRLVLVKQDETPFSEEELSSIKSEYGAKSYLHYDKLLDSAYSEKIVIPFGNSVSEHEYLSAQWVCNQNYGNDIVGKYPTENNEVFLYLPISYQPSFGETSLKVSKVLFRDTPFDLVGVKYYFDNNLTPKCLVTEGGLRVATALSTCPSLDVRIYAKREGYSQEFNGDNARYIKTFVSFEIPSDKIYVKVDDFYTFCDSVKQNENSEILISLYHNYYGSGERQYINFSDNDILNRDTELIDYNYYGMNNGGIYINNCLFISDEALCELADKVEANSYKQASLFFENDATAYSVAEKLQEKGYVAIPSSTTYKGQLDIADIFSMILSIFIWLVTVVFFAFFINLCLSRTLTTIKGDMAIMRSMGIPVKVIRISMYVRMMISIIPAFILTIGLAILIFTNPIANKMFVYLYPWQYAIIFVGMLALTIITTRKLIRKLFEESVKKSLKGDV